MKNEILPAVAAIIFDRFGHILLQKRRDRDVWGLISGHVEFGESVEQAIIREIREETNVEPRLIRLIGVYSSASFQTYNYTDRIVQYVTIYFEAALTSELIENFSNHESEKLQFFPKDKLPRELDLTNPYWLQDAMHVNKQVFVR